MKTQQTIILAGALLLLFSFQSVLAEKKTESYQGAFQGDTCSVTINWANYSGQGAVDGKIITQSGIILPFFGSNPRSGYMEIEIQGRQHQLNKKKSGNNISWNGQSLSFSRSPSGGAMSPPVRKPAPAGGFRKDYIGTWRGEEITAHLNFVPESDPDVLYTADGGIIKNGVAYSISAWQPRPDYIELGIDTDSENHKLSKEANSGRTSWVGRWVSLTEKGAGGGISGTRPPVPSGLPKPPTYKPLPKPPTTHIPPGYQKPPTTYQPPTPPIGQPAPNPTAAANAKWVIACEAQSSKSEAESNAKKWKNRGFKAGVVWIPDYSSLSGVNMWLTHVGPYDYRTGKSQAEVELKKVRQFYSDAYGIKLDQSGQRETF
tara:strand:+ start:1073 stop:2194 length:1122 start_codon:yes stop_codon:yes gene_type:complete